MSRQTGTVSSSMVGVSESTRIGRLVCPACDNDDPNSMLLFAATIAPDCYSFDRVVNGVPVFAFGKSVDHRVRPRSTVRPVQCLWHLVGRQRSERKRCADGATTPSVHQFTPGLNFWSRVVILGPLRTVAPLPVRTRPILPVGWVEEETWIWILVDSYSLAGRKS